MDVATFDTVAPRVAAVGRDAAAVAADLPEPLVVLECGDLDALRERLEPQREPLAEGGVDCVVSTAAGTDPDVAAVLDAVDAVDPELPVVVAPAEPEPELAAGLADRPATHYLPRSAAGERDAAALASVVRAAVDAYDRRRQAAVERGYFREVMREAPLSIYLKDDRARHVAVSSEADRAVEGSPVGRTDRELFGEDGETPDSYEDDRAVLATGEPIEDREEVVHLDGGKDLWLRTSKVPRRDEDGAVVGLLGVTRDVTPEKRRERELRRETRRLEQFASFASHDLRNPLTVARGTLERARESGDPELVGTALEELDRMERLIDDLLEIARTGEDAGTEWVPLAEVVERTWSAVEAPAASLTVDVPEDLEVRASRGALRQLLENVLGNAVDHAGPDVAVAVGLTDDGFYVADDGPGIPEDERDSVFEFGFTTGGTGVGLAIAAEIADAHGWEPVATESEAGGARVEFHRTMRRRSDAPEPVEGEALAPGEWRTVGDLDAPGGAAVPAAAASVEATPEASGQAISASPDDERWTIRGGGEALWVDIEEYAALATDVEGGVRIEARLRSVEQLHEYSKAGLLLADATEPDRPLAFVGMTAGHGTESARRDAPGEPVETEQVEPDARLPRWYRIDRLGDRVDVAASADGEDWRLVDQHVLPLSDPVSVGLAVCGHEPGTACEATFEDVRVVRLAPGEE